jgi:hypothetical protein
VARSGSHLPGTKRRHVTPAVACRLMLSAALAGSVRPAEILASARAAYPHGAAQTRIISVARIRLDPGNLRDLSKGYFATTFLSSSLTCPATQSGLYQPTCRLDLNGKPVPMFFRPGSESLVVRGMLKRLAPLAPKGDLFFLHYLDVLPPDGGGRFTQSECPLGQLQIACCKRHQIFGYARLTTLLCEPYAPFG